MRKKIVFYGIVCLLIIVFGYKYYYSNYTNEGILEKVKNRDGYILNQIQESVMIKLFIKPEWIPFNSNEKIELNKKLLEIHGTNIILGNVWNRGNDIYFSFRTTYSMDHNKGEFLYNVVFNEDGTGTFQSKLNGTMLYDKNHKNFDVGQTGSSGSSSFSFGIVPANFKYIEEGFYVIYSDFILYEYIKQ